LVPLIKPDFGFECVVIYIREAHPDADWPIGTPEEYAVARQPASMQERFAAIEQLKRNVPAYNEDGVLIYADSMRNTVQQLLNAWPTRFFLFVDGALALRSTPGDEAHLDLLEFLQECQRLLGRAPGGC
jgi:hypothetical protein